MKKNKYTRNEILNTTNEKFNLKHQLSHRKSRKEGNNSLWNLWIKSAMWNVTRSENFIIAKQWSWMFIKWEKIIIPTAFSEKYKGWSVVEYVLANQRTADYWNCLQCFGAYLILFSPLLYKKTSVNHLARRNHRFFALWLKDNALSGPQIDTQ